MLDHNAIHLACRAKALTFAGATTGSATLAATATGYTRLAGSFLTDGFAVGQEITASGFSTSANNGTAVILSVTATAMVVTAYTITATSTGYTYAARTLAVEASAAARTLAVSLPVLRAWENVEFTPTAGLPYVHEQYVPGPTSLEAFGTNAAIEVTPMYVLHFYVKANTGISGDGKYADKALTLFAPGTQITVGSDTVEVRAAPGPYRGQRYQFENGFSMVPVNVPLWGLTANSI